jgi:hypothetical protein
MQVADFSFPANAVVFPAQEFREITQQTTENIGPFEEF